MFPKPKIVKKRPLRNKRITEFLPCYLCGFQSSEWHEALMGNNRQLSIEHDLKVPLCKLCHDHAHNDRKFNLRLQKEMQQKFEKEHGHDEFMRVFGKNYLDELSDNSG